MRRIDWHRLVGQFTDEGQCLLAWRSLDQGSTLENTILDADLFESAALTALSLMLTRIDAMATLIAPLLCSSPWMLAIQAKGPLDQVWAKLLVVLLLVFRNLAIPEKMKINKIQ
jgi:hypothetical protein